MNVANLQLEGLMMAIAALALATGAGAQAACNDCGVVQSIRQIEQQGAVADAKTRNAILRSAMGVA